MPRNSSHRLFSRIRQEVLGSPARVLSWLSLVWIAVILLTCLEGVGGYLYYGYPMMQVSWMVGVLAFLHAIWRVVSRHGSELNRWALAPLPFLGLAGLSQWLITPEPWAGELHLWAYLQAYVLYFVLVHQVRHRSEQAFVLVILIGVATWAFLGAFFQFYINPDWFPLEGRVRSAAFEDRAAGFLAIPDAFAGLMVLLVPFLFLGARMRRFAGPVRIICGFLTVCFVVGALVAVSRPVLVSLLIAMVLLPTFAVAGAQRRMKTLGWFGLALLVLLPVLYFSSDILKESLRTAASFSDETIRPVLWRGALEMLTASPVLGQGMGAFAGQWPQFQYTPLGVSPHYAHSDFLQLLAEFGLVGAAALLIPWFWLLVRSIQAWVQIPFHSVHEEQLFRASRSSRSGRELRSRHRRSRHKGGHHQQPVPRQKLIIGGLLVGLIVFTIQEVGSFNLQIPVVLFFFAMVTGLLVQVAFPSATVSLPGGGMTRVIVAALIAALGSGSMGRARLVYSAQGEAFIASEHLQWLIEDPDRIFEHPERLGYVEALFARAIRLNPGHGEAWSGFAQLGLLHYYLDYSNQRGASELAYARLARAMELRPHHYANYLIRANALAGLGAGMEVIEPVLEEAVNRAPLVAEVHLYYANFLLRLGSDRERAEARLEQALSLNPDLKAALDLMDDLKLQ